MQRILLVFLINFLFPISLYGDETDMLSISAEESSTKEVTKFAVLDNYYIDKTEVTQKDYIEVMGKTKFFFRGENHPAEQITWFKAKAYCEKIGKRLPTQLEWEKAAGGKSKSKYFWGNKPDANFAWYGGDYDLGHHPVGVKKPNNYGLFDTSGNVWEWTSTKDKKVSKYSGEIIDKRIVMGGAFNVSANLITTTSSMSLYAKSRLFNVGFRCAK
jgi:formylglycine-generating enzyme